MQNLLKNILFYGLWLIVIYFALKLVAISLGYFSFDFNYDFLRQKRHMLGNKLWVLAFFIHLFFGITAVLSGLPLFFKRLIHFRSAGHRWIGRVYIFSILGLTGPTGLYLSIYAEGGIWASIGFASMSIAWIIPTLIAYLKVRNKDYTGHYKWIIRSFSMTLSGVTLRLFTPIGAHYLGFDYETNFIVSSYVWILNVILGEIILFFNKERIKNLATLLAE